MFSTGRIPGSELGLVCLANFGFGAFLMTWFLFFIGLVTVLRDATPYERRKAGFATEF